MSTFIMVSTHEEHGIQGIMVADRGSMVQRRDDLFVVLMSISMSMVSAKRTENVECLDGQMMGRAQMLAVLDKELSIDLNHLVPVAVFLVEFEKHSVRPGQALVMDVAGVAARTINTNIDLLGLMEMMRAMMANCKTYCNVDSLRPEIFRQSKGPSTGYDRLPDKQE